MLLLITMPSVHLVNGHSRHTGAQAAAQQLVEDLVREEDQEADQQHDPAHHQTGEGDQVEQLVTVVLLSRLCPLDLEHNNLS